MTIQGVTDLEIAVRLQLPATRSYRIGVAMSVEVFERRSHFGAQCHQLARARLEEPLLLSDSVL